MAHKAILFPQNIEAALDSYDSDDDLSLAFMAKIFVQVTLPHSDPGNIDYWIKRNGHYTLRLSAGEAVRDGKVIKLGLPFGSIPRLLLMWITTQVLRTQNRTVDFGPNMSHFLQELGLKSTGGKNGSLTRFKEQLLRLVNCRISFGFDDHNNILGTQFYLIEDKNIKWIDDSSSHLLKKNKKNSTIRINEKFYEQILKSSIPLDMQVIFALKQSPLAIDMYAWLTYRVSYLKKSNIVTWLVLHQQMGADYKDIRNFKKKVVNVLRTIKTLYPQINIESTKKGLNLNPSKSHVNRKTLLN